MRYTTDLRIIRRRKHTIKTSLILSGFIFLLVIFLGFTFLDAQKFFVGFLESLIRVVIAYIASLIFSTILALIVTSSSKVEELFLPILDVLQSFPSFALYPLLIVWFGKSAIVTILILFVEMIWPILFTILAAKKQLREDVLDAAKIFGGRGFKFLRYILLPSLFPALVTGSIIAWGEAWETIIAAEIIVDIPGIGSYLAGTGASGATQLLLIGIVLLLALLYLLNKYIWIPLLNLSTRYQNE